MVADMEQEQLWKLFMNTGLPEAYLAVKGEERKHQWLGQRVQEVKNTFETPPPPGGLS